MALRTWLGRMMMVGVTACSFACSGTGTEDDPDPCQDLCSCVSSSGGDESVCSRQCAQARVSSTRPADTCRSALSQNGVSSCSSHCDAFTPAAPGDELGQCAGPGAMTVGESFRCDLGKTVTVDYLALSVGCNDGETGQFEIQVGNNPPAALEGSCGSSTHVGPFRGSDVTVRFVSGGGSDNHISFSDLGSMGLIVGYR